MARPVFDRRNADRSRVRLPTGLKATYRSPDGVRREVMTQLVDVSRSGVGVEAHVAIPNGAEIEISGEMHAEGLDLRLDALARVVYCRPVGEGAYRVGLEFVEAAFARAS